MSLIGWNCRGLGKPRAVRVLTEMLKSHKPDLLFLSETLAVSNKIEAIASKLGFADFFSVDRQGMGGGLAVFWRKSLNCKILNHSQNHIDMQVNEGSRGLWRLTCFYGYPERERRQDSWDFLRSLAHMSTLPWCIFGDFNDLLYIADKKRRHPHPQRLMDGFKNAIEDCELIEVDLKG